MGGTSVIAQFNAFVLLGLLVAQTVIVVEGQEDDNPFEEICSNYECPTYTVINKTQFYEIRRYNSSVWISTDYFSAPSFSLALADAEIKLSEYFNGENEYKKEINRALPLLTTYFPRGSRLPSGNFTVSSYLPAENYADPPPAEGLNVTKWGSSAYAAVIQFQPASLEDYNIVEEADRLKAFLKGTYWEEAIKKSQDPSTLDSYSLVQYDPLFSHDVIIVGAFEIWITFEMEDDESAKRF